MSKLDEAGQSWEARGAVAPVDLSDARLQAHFAAQLAAAVGMTLADPKPDDSHANLEWFAAERELASAPARGLRGTLHVASLTLRIRAGSEGVVAELSLRGKTLDQGREWLEAALAQKLGETVTLAKAPYDMPVHSVGDGAAFDANETALLELERWFSSSDRLLRALEAETANASPVRCWPHHFDIATLISLDPSKSGEDAQTVGVGMTPGDGGYPEPYFYVTPWPYPKEPSPPDLEGGGTWHREGWFGAVLTGTRLVGADDPATSVTAFVRSAVEASRALAGA